MVENESSLKYFIWFILFVCKSFVCKSYKKKIKKNKINIGSILQSRLSSSLIIIDFRGGPEGGPERGPEEGSRSGVQVMSTPATVGLTNLMQSLHFGYRRPSLRVGTDFNVHRYFRV